MVKKIPSWLKLLIKIMVSGICLWYVSRKVNWAQSLRLITQGNILWLAAATLLFAASKVAASFRLNIYFKNINVNLPEKTNLKLYWLGMFYNLFLPGGIGGDAYKIILLNRTYNFSAKQLTSAVLLDRLSGVVGLAILAVLYYYGLFTGNTIALLLLIAILPGLFIYYVLVKKLFNAFIKSFFTTLWLGIAVQALQAACAWCIMQALHITGHQSAYLLIFLLSSIVVILPVTVGPLGTRELVFVWGSTALLLNKDQSIGISITFFIITLVISLPGMYWVYKNPLGEEVRSGGASKHTQK